MFANTAALGLGFYKLVQVKNNELLEAIVSYDGADTALLDSYVLATDKNDDYVFTDNVGNVELVQVNALTVVYSANGGLQCYEQTITAYKDANGSIWMDEQLHDEVFC
jgi:hypothetical protein